MSSASFHSKSRLCHVLVSSLISSNRYGEIIHIELIRDHKTGKSKGFAFLQYEDQRSTILAVDNLNGADASILVLCCMDPQFNITSRFWDVLCVLITLLDLKSKRREREKKNRTMTSPK